MEGSCSMLKCSYTLNDMSGPSFLVQPCCAALSNSVKIMGLCLGSLRAIGI